MKQLFDAYIFDIDGTLTNTNQLIFDSFNFIAKKYLDKTFSDEEIISLFGPTEDEILREWCGDQFDEAKEDYYSYYTNYHSIAQLYPGIKEILEYLRNNKYPLGIFTGKGREASMITLKYLGVEKYFDLIISGDDVKNHKPSAEGILKFLNHFKLKPKKVLMIGDSVSDVKASKEAGIRIASALWDSYGEEKVKTLESDYYFYSVGELKKSILKNS
ncbi:MAG: HAD-IA family hydrolase [Ignavibacteria bacterium]|nr:HAD-IA family hydrolase [Ignavibacteria bacterium]MBT8380966.1 HAD-IA family hydrolase [Ignavibacteria bacterium]MBT8392352.1 HAD-IA family hydrolase [Ignavibacteria bacterium]NNJ53104.1 HAD-IA family hydrolase [Ignavibacteriaceae bacterium]NNL22224.1 HAD-IA family hydrolase [Ignavibacteriaceae bacterium]